MDPFDDLIERVKASNLGFEDQGAVIAAICFAKNSCAAVIAPRGDPIRETLYSNARECLAGMVRILEQQAAQRG